MEYCGVKYIAVQATTGPLWKWRILHTNKTSTTRSGESADQTAAIAHAHEAIGLSLRTICETDDERPMPHLADEALHILHGARRLPAAVAVEALRPFAQAMHHDDRHISHLGAASANAIQHLVTSLSATQTASDDLWQSAINSTLSFANELSGTSEDQA